LITPRGGRKDNNEYVAARIPAAIERASSPLFPTSPDFLPQRSTSHAPTTPHWSPFFAP
jgi:hypothetical protein